MIKLYVTIMPLKLTENRNKKSKLFKNNRLLLMNMYDEFGLNEVLVWYFNFVVNLHMYIVKGNLICRVE